MLSTDQELSSSMDAIDLLRRWAKRYIVVFITILVVVAAARGINQLTE
jgi:hypothetical protein